MEIHQAVVALIPAPDVGYRAVEAADNNVCSAGADACGLAAVTLDADELTADVELLLRRSGADADVAVARQPVDETIVACAPDRQIVRRGGDIDVRPVGEEKDVLGPGGVLQHDIVADDVDVAAHGQRLVGSLR